MSMELDSSTIKNGKNRANSCPSQDDANPQRDNSIETSFLKPLAPKESDFEDIKLISNGAYG